MLSRAPLRLWREVTAAVLSATPQLAPVAPAMPPVLPRESGPVPLGYRPAGTQWLRLDLAEYLLVQAHGRRACGRARGFVLDPANAMAAGVSTANFARLLGLAGFRPISPRALGEGHFGPLAPLVWRWQPTRTEHSPAPPPPTDGAFAALARLVA